MLGAAYIGFLCDLCYNYGMKKLLRGLVLMVGMVVGVSASVNTSMSTDVSAKISESQLFFYGQNGIYFYNGSGGVNCDPATEGGENYNYAGATVWSEAELAAISANEAVYKAAAEKYGIPWQTLAVIHSMETGLTRTNPANGQGLYQLYSYTSGGTNGNRFATGAVSDAEFQQQTEIAAGIISARLNGATDAGAIQRMFFSYNGASKQYIEKALAMGYSQEEAENGAGSPYVMNRYDGQRDPTSGSMSASWAGRYTADGVYTSSSTSSRFGAYVKYTALTGVGGVCSSGGGSIADVALRLSWNGRGHSKTDASPEYIEAMKSVGAYIAPCNGSGCAPVGASCDQFVGTVMRYSGADTNYPIFGPGVQEAYMASHPDMYQKVNASSVSDLLPGDIFVTNENGRHIYIYAGIVNGVPTQASASFNDRTAENFAGVYFSDGGTGAGARGYTVYRRIQ